MRKHVWTGVGIVTFIVVGSMLLAVLPTFTATPSSSPTHETPIHHVINQSTPHESVAQYKATLTPQELSGFNFGQKLAQRPGFRPVIDHNPANGGIRLAVSFSAGAYLYIHFTHADADTIVWYLNLSGAGYTVALVVGIVTLVSAGVGAAISVFLAANALLFWYLATLAADQQINGVAAWWCGDAGNFILFQACPSVAGQVGAAYLVAAPLTSPSGYKWEVNVHWTGFTVDLDWYNWIGYGGFSMDWPACPC
jgi:hypothetical protein